MIISIISLLFLYSWSYGMIDGQYDHSMQENNAPAYEPATIVSYPDKDISSSRDDAYEPSDNYRESDSSNSDSDTNCIIS